ncbi:MAG: aminoacyl-tRNA hydrolase [Fibromonadaceae bacterium]|jgi:PTH1 family peptidyl-tRNA hydrolase|nr:aminoacyl-tRNA hydrolase [Fibromonadaceae bacterium]
MQHLFVGLGNPGHKYAGTRHNLGFMAIDRLADAVGGGKWKSECKAETLKIHFADKAILLAKPHTFMNLSGESVQALMAFHKVKPENLLVFSDDVHIPCGTLRIRPHGSAGGQNGLKNIIDKMGQNFARVRIGAGKPPPNCDLIDWVLSAISKEDAPHCKHALDQIPKLCEIYLKEGIATAQNEFNR